LAKLSVLPLLLIVILLMWLLLLMGLMASRLLQIAGGEVLWVLLWVLRGCLC
jgi:hypothetical protein